MRKDDELTDNSKWLGLSEKQLSPKEAKKLLDEWRYRLSILDYAFEFELTKDKWSGSFQPLLGVHYGKLTFSTERTLVHELLEAMLYRYFSLSAVKRLSKGSIDNTDDVEYKLRHLFLFDIVNCLLRLKYDKHRLSSDN